MIAPTIHILVALAAVICTRSETGLFLQLDYFPLITNRQVIKVYATHICKVTSEKPMFAFFHNCP